MRLLRTLVVVVLVALIGAAAFVYFGAFNVAADVPHWPIVYRLLEATRQRSIAARATGIAMPVLDDPKRIAAGAEHYGEMCTGCHLAPGVRESELRNGLYPTPPDFTQRNDIDPAQMFWAIKHGVKLTAMPAWGKSHDDDAIWALVAFVKKMPDLTPEQYQQTIARAGEHGHHHHGEAGDDHGDHEHGDHEHTGEAQAGDQHAQGADQHGDHEHAPATPSAERQADVHTRGADVMPFSLDATQHVFEKTTEGGTQRVVAREGHSDQVAKIREHLQSMAHAFTARDFSGPAHIHSSDMPGLAELKAAPSSELAVSYRDIANGGEVTYRGTTEPIRNAIHRWFDAQLTDHGRDATDHKGRP